MKYILNLHTFSSAFYHAFLFWNFLNDKAQFPFPVTIEDVLTSPLVADPLRLLDCSPITDGAAAVILASEKAAKQFENPVWIKSCEQASDTLALHDRESFTEMRATKIAAKAAYEEAGLTPDKINIAEVHDCFSINEIMAIEDLGFFKKGEGGKAVEKGKTVEYVGFSHQPSLGLIKFCSESTLLKEEDLKQFLSPHK